MTTQQDSTDALLARVRGIVVLLTRVRALLAPNTPEEEVEDLEFPDARKFDVLFAVDAYPFEGTDNELIAAYIQWLETTFPDDLNDSTKVLFPG